MKGFVLLVVLAAAGLGGVFYWRQHVQATRAPVVAAAEPAKHAKNRRHRQRRGARRMARNEVFVASAPPAEDPVAEGMYSARAPSPRPAPEERPLAPGGSATTEAAPSEVFGALSPSPSAQPSGGRRQVVDEPEPIKLRAADLKIVWQGEDLSKAEVQRFDLSSDGRELSQDEIDTRFRAKEDAVLGCINRARPDEYTYVPGRVTVKFRIQKTGVVKGVQVEAPVILHRGGLTGCIKGVVGGLRFPASNMSQVISYPFSLT